MRKEAVGLLLWPQLSEVDAPLSPPPSLTTNWWVTVLSKCCSSARYLHMQQVLPCGCHSWREKKTKREIIQGWTGGRTRGKIRKDKRRQRNAKQETWGKATDEDNQTGKWMDVTDRQEHERRNDTEEGENNRVKDVVTGRKRGWKRTERSRIRRDRDGDEAWKWNRGIKHIRGGEGKRGRETGQALQTDRQTERLRDWCDSPSAGVCTNPPL